MRLNSSGVSELVKLSIKLPPMGEVGGASDFKGKEVMRVGQLTRVNATSRTVQVNKQHKPRQKSQRKGKAKVLIRDRGESSQCHSKVVMRVLREWVGENIMGRSSKPVTIAPNASDGGLLCRWGSFDPQKLAQFGKLLEKPVRLKPGWPNNGDMTI
ncbi:hypothetical protein J1N35_043810 [Gossypium stocksii]|uniref:Uncharacterized protein n=1 Tax=Gossypium stocksii TaxID=47602 RepID=A0A9D3U8B4_9ROSI|nr:hypothetical protein J1N35_043810 [Gossypium stocksii]